MKIGIGLTCIEGVRTKLLKWTNTTIDFKFGQRIELVYVQNVDHFENRIGIAKAKNNCLRRLIEQHCDHFFLFDDDTFPMRSDWHLKFIEAAQKNKQHHLSYLPEKGNYMGKLSNIAKAMPFGDGLLIYPYSWGNMLYFDNYCIETAGGYNEDFEIYGYEHCELSMRIYNMGLTAAPYMTIENVRDYIYACDYEGFPKWLEPENHSLDGLDMAPILEKNRKLFEKMYKSDKKIEL